MDIFSIIAIPLLILATLWWVLKPLWRGADYNIETVSVQEHDLVELEERREIIYTAIKDLELDHEAGKISTTDYQQTRLKFARQAADILKQIDQLSQSAASQTDAEIDAMLAQFQAERAGADEAMLTAVRAEIEREAAVSPAGLACPNCRQPITANDIFCSHCGNALANRCPSCQNATTPGDVFCTRCGARLVVEVTQ